jgi:hypothetical protein
MLEAVSYVMARESDYIEKRAKQPPLNSSLGGLSWVSAS